MTAQQSDGRMDGFDVGTLDRVDQRARQLCLRAEPHAGESPCPAHLAEARRQLLASQD